MTGQNIASRFDEIYNSTYASVAAFVTAKCGNTADISDIVQETYMELYQLLHRRGADYIKNSKAITLKIAGRKLARHYSHTQRAKIFVPLVSTNEDGDEFLLSDLQADSFLTEEFAINNILLEQAREILRGKPEDVKKVFCLHFDLGLTISETAKRLSMSESNVKHKLYRTLKEIREILQ
ncbi:MAG: sigma-70 family RNA polymerase sigma factor [Oscillospiraceae bacterium]|nr:sigma-70 family RNA polymerase sigma factor [Oscillospiraceae bacterium]